MTSGDLQPGMIAEVSLRLLYLIISLLLSLLRLVIEEVHVTGWHVQIRLRIPLDDNPDGPPRPPNPDPGPDRPGPMSTEDRLRSLGTYEAAMPAQDRVRGDQAMATQCSGQPPHEGGEHGPVRPVHAWSWVLRRRMATS